MSCLGRMSFRAVDGIAGVLAVMALALGWPTPAHAQNNNGGVVGFTSQNAVGGVWVDADGVLANATVDAIGELRRQRKELLGSIPADLAAGTTMRKISLRRLDAAIRQCVENGQPLPDEIVFLAGLQRIEYVLVDPEQNDIVLVGPAEGWRVDAKGAVVGMTTGYPVMLLDDLLVALHATAGPTRSVFSCSIDPTPEGLRRLSAFAKTLRTIGNPQVTAARIEEHLGPQKISVAGVPETSHFARVMVAADYRMKRISMELEPAPIAGLPSYLQMVRPGGQGMHSMLPRWWLAPNYEPLLRDAEGLTWQLRGAGVKAMAESDFLDSTGVKHQTGRADVVSQRWADLLTARYEELSRADPIFGQLRNCMDLAVVAALLVKENLVEKAQCPLPMLINGSALPTTQLAAPKQVASQAAVMHKGRKWVIATGGVLINPWAVVEQSQVSDTLADARGEITLQDGQQQWWSN